MLTTNRTSRKYWPASVLAFVWFCSVIAGCQSGDSPATEHDQSFTTKSEQLFTKVDAGQSGILFQNKITETPELNYLNYNNIYSGGGVATGDLNNDGLPDLYFTGNMVADAIYLNKGNLQFTDISATAIMSGHDGWHRGVVFTDINADGHLDIYVCRSGWQSDPAQRANLLYINNGEADSPTFTESAAAYGLADTSHSTQAVFFDFDRDGDLDCYVLNHPAERRPDQQPLSVDQVKRLIKSGKAESDRLYENNGNQSFTDITAKAGLFNMSYSLGVGVTDVDNNGWPDLYIANDYAEPDFLYVNQGDGTFVNEVNSRTGHVSNFGMGVDMADFNNDGFQDIAVVDMAYKNMVLSKKNMGAMRPAKFQAYVDIGYQYQYMSNTLQLNNGNGTFSEIAQLAGVAKTDWSWSPLFADLDNDGWTDLYVTNGNKRDVRNNDAQVNLQNVFAATGGKADFNRVVNLMPERLVPNNCFRNNGILADGGTGLTFTDQSSEWGLNEPSTAHGVAIADFDLDGDLDVVMNREDAPATLYQNNNNERANYLRIRLNGPQQNPQGLGAKVWLTTENGQQYKEMQVVRGYQSCQEAVLHFGLGNNAAATVEVAWPDGRWTTIEVKSNQQIALAHAESNAPDAPNRPDHSAPKAQFFAAAAPLSVKHSEAPFDDFATEILMPHRYSRLGPFVSSGDVNADGRDDLFISGAAGSVSNLYLQQADGSFRVGNNQPWQKMAAAEDLGSALFDADKDGDLDLLVMPGGNEHPIKSPLLRPRLYHNDGNGNFSDVSDRLPEIITSGMRIAVGDIDNDGDNDLFLPGRITPGFYPFAPRSYLLRNDGGKFTDITQEMAPDLMGPGLITDAQFADMDNDGDADLVIVGEWLPVSIYQNDGGRFSNITSSTSLARTNGWWYSLAIADLDGDGDLDIAAGNLGYNAKYHASDTEPLHVYCADFDQSGSYDIVLAMHQENKVYPVRGRECSSEQMPFIKQKFPTYSQFAEANLSAVYSQAALDQAKHFEAYELASCVFLNNGNGDFVKQRLPMQAQFAPINAIKILDVNADGNLDLIAAGNNHDPEVETIRYDAGTGLILLGNGKGKFSPAPIVETGFFAHGNVRDLAIAKSSSGQLLIVTNNNGQPQSFRLLQPNNPF